MVAYICGMQDIYARSDKIRYISIALISMLGEDWKI